MQKPYLFIFLFFLMINSHAQNARFFKKLDRQYHSKKSIQLASQLLAEKQEKRKLKSSIKKQFGITKSAKREESLVKDIPYGKYQEWKQFDESQASHRGISAFDTIIELGPITDVGGRTRSILYDAANPNKVFAGAVSGGLWVSTNNTESWNPVDDAAANLSITSITQNPFNPSIIYYSTGERYSTIGNGIYKSIDGGNTFQNLPTTLSIPDFKYTWRIEHSLTDANTVYVSTQNGKLYRTQDGGNTWKIVFDTNKQIRDVLILPNGKILTTVTDIGIYSSNSGDSATFNIINSAAFPLNFQIIELANCKSQPNIIYAAFSDKVNDNGVIGFCKSNDGGNTWVKRDIPPIISTQGDYNLMLGVHPNNPDFLICGGVLTSFSTNGANGGLSWIITPLIHSDEHSFTANPNNANEFLIGNDGGVWKFKWNEMLTPLAKNNGYRVTQFNGGSYDPTGYGCLGGTQDNGTQKINIGFNSIQTTFADGGYCHISQTNLARAYVTQQEGNLFRTDNYNAAIPWYLTNFIKPPLANTEGVRFYNIFQMNYADDNQLYYRTNKGIWRSTNAGVNWTRMNDDQFFTYWLECSKEFDPVLYVYGDSFSTNKMALYRYENAITSNNKILVDVAYNLNLCRSGVNCSMSDIDIHPNNNSTLLICKGIFDTFPKMFKIEKAETLNPISTVIQGDLPIDLPVNTILFDPFFPETKYYAGTENGLYYTENGGVNWMKEFSIPNVIVNDLKMREDGTLFVYTYGRGIWVAKTKKTTTEFATLPYQINFESGNLDGYSSLSTSNVNGRIKISPTNQPNGNYSVQLNASSTNRSVILKYDIRLNLAGKQNVFLKFDYKLFENTTANTGIFISDNNGITFKKAYTFNNNNLSSWKTDSFNLSKIIDSLGSTHTANFIVRFQDSTKAEIPNGGLMVDNISITENIITSISNNNALQNEISVYPNPTKDVLYIDGIAKVKSLQSIYIYDLSGKMILPINLNTHQDRIVVNVTTLPKANYVIVFETTEGNFTKKIIIQ